MKIAITKIANIIGEIATIMSLFTTLSMITLITVAHGLELSMLNIIIHVLCYLIASIWITMKISQR